MVLPIVQYGHPVLRQRGIKVQDITPEIRKLVEDMFETMYEAAGIGLAAQQIGQALQLTVIDVSQVEDRPSTMEVDGKGVKVEDHMPLVLINPEIEPQGEREPGPEGCLSFPELYGDVIRPEGVVVKAQDLEGKEIRFSAGGLLSRAVQHEVDHLNGILFIDRMTTQVKEEIRSELDRLQAATKASLS